MLRRHPAGGTVPCIFALASLLCAIASHPATAACDLYQATIQVDDFLTADAAPAIVTFENVPRPNGFGTLTVSAESDLQLADEYLTIRAEHFNLGPIFNDDAADDRFDHAFGRTPPALTV